MTGVEGKMGLLRTGRSAFEFVFRHPVESRPIQGKDGERILFLAVQISSIDLAMERHQATRSHGICVTIFADYPIISRKKEAVFQKNALHGPTWCVFSREIIPFAPDDSRFL